MEFAPSAFGTIFAVLTGGFSGGVRGREFATRPDVVFEEEEDFAKNLKEKEKEKEKHFYWQLQPKGWKNAESSLVYTSFSSHRANTGCYSRAGDRMGRLISTRRREAEKGEDPCPSGDILFRKQQQW